MAKKGPVEHFFASHAQGYSKSRSHAHGPDLDALVQALKPKKTDIALDVATGTGFTAFSLARVVKHVTGIDVTKEMLEEAKKLVLSEGLRNVKFEPGDALGTKYSDSSFDVVTSRRASHHFEDVPRFLRETKRILRPGGRLGVVDMAPPEGAETFSNKIEKLRDSSHVEAFTPSAWESMITDAGFRIVSSEVLSEPVSFEGWLYPVELGGKEEKAIRLAWSSAPMMVKQLLAARIERGEVTGWSKSRIVMVASKTP